MAVAGNGITSKEVLIMFMCFILGWVGVYFVNIIYFSSIGDSKLFAFIVGNFVGLIFWILSSVIIPDEWFE